MIQSCVRKETLIKVTRDTKYYWLLVPAIEPVPAPLELFGTFFGDGFPGHTGQKNC